MKKVFLKAPGRKQLFKQYAPNIPLPPKPIITRWGTWLAAVKYYSVHLSKLCDVFDMLDEDEAASICMIKNILNSNVLKNNIAFVSANFVFISDCITKLETQGLSINEALNVVNDAQNRINSVTGETAGKIKVKTKSVLEKNPGFKKIQNIGKILSGLSDVSVNELSASEIGSFKFAPITSCDVERSFLVYKTILNDRRMNLTPENIKFIMVVQCNSN